MSGKERYSDFSPRLLRILWSLLIATLALSIAAEFFIHKHGYFPLEETTAFHAWFGFISCAAIVVVSKLYGFAVKRRESYYLSDKESH